MVHSAKKQRSEGHLSPFGAHCPVGGSLQTSEATAEHVAGLSGIVKLNVGGSPYVTTYRTLLAHEGSRFAVYFRQLFAHLAHNAPASTVGDDFLLIAYDRAASSPTVFIDRDGARFSYILDYLRDGDVALPADPSLCRALLQDARYFRLPGLEITISHFLSTTAQGMHTPRLSHKQEGTPVKCAGMGSALSEPGRLLTADGASACSQRLYSLGSSASTSAMVHTFEDSQSRLCSQHSYDEDLLSSQKSVYQIDENDNIEDSGVFVQTTPLSRLGKTEFSTSVDF
ncbi:BTB/POZ domain-containing protein KCTD12-like [Babesia caballi]|uniref:BTB/POZ domain-containing protein KCTD12-like n=1 Tax=Babesia caballi TaxID=5871 RepID=A0AAV4LX22_BABCB|nr:BTB/POZ domain-containing protein KCTD12-like [Babesia caballi]